MFFCWDLLCPSPTSALDSDETCSSLPWDLERMSCNRGEALTGQLIPSHFPVRTRSYSRVWHHVSYGFLWFLMVSYGFLWFLMVSYGFLWFLMVSYGFLWLRMASYGFVWFRMVSYGFLWFLMVSYDFLWFLMVSYGFLWFLMVS